MRSRPCPAPLTAPHAPPGLRWPTHCPPPGWKARKSTAAQQQTQTQTPGVQHAGSSPCRKLALHGMRPGTHRIEGGAVGSDLVNNLLCRYSAGAILQAPGDGKSAYTPALRAANTNAWCATQHMAGCIVLKRTCSHSVLMQETNASNASSSSLPCNSTRASLSLQHSTQRKREQRAALGELSWSPCLQKLH